MWGGFSLPLLTRDLVVFSPYCSFEVVSTAVFLFACVRYVVTKSYLARINLHPEYPVSGKYSEKQNPMQPSNEDVRSQGISFTESDLECNHNDNEVMQQ